MSRYSEVKGFLSGMFLTLEPGAKKTLPGQRF